MSTATTEVEVKPRPLTAAEKLACELEEYAQGMETESSAAIGVDGCSSIANAGYFYAQVARKMREGAEKLREQSTLLEGVPTEPKPVEPAKKK